MEFRLLGPVELIADGESVVVGGPRQRALLALFLLHANDVVSREVLIDGLWGEEPPPAAEATLKAYVARLRKLLGANCSGVRLVTHPHGYELELDLEALDLERFRQRSAVGKAQLAEGDAAGAERALREALVLWRAPALADLTRVPFARVAQARLEEERLAAVEERVEADLALGRHADLIPELERLVGDNPYRERLRAQLMLALYRSDRQAESLRVYADGRARLVRDLGLEPTRTLVDLERAILTHDPSIEAQPQARGGGGVGADLAAGVAHPRHRRRLVPRIPPVSRFGRRGGTIAIAAVAAVAAALAALLVGTTRSSPEARQAAPDSVVAVNGGRVTAIAPVGAFPIAVVAQRGFVWVLSRGDATLSKLEARSGAVVKTVSARGTPVGLAVGEGSVWLIGMANKHGIVLRIDAETGEVVNTRLLGTMIPRAVIAGEGGIWVAAELPGRPGVLLRLSPRTTTVASRLPLPIKPTALALGQHEIWVVGRPAGDAPSGAARVALYGLDPATGRIVARAVLRADPHRSRIAISTRSIWLSDGRGAILRLDPITAHVAAKMRIEGDTVAIAADGRSLWAVDRSAVLRRLDLSDGRVLSRTELAPRGNVSPTDLAVEGSLIWISVARGAPAARPSVRSTVRIGHMRAVSIPVAGTPTRVRYGAGAIWVKPLSGRLIRIDPRTNRVVAKIAVGTGWGDIAFGFGSVWATSFDTNTVSRIDPRTNHVVARVATRGLAPMGIAATRDAIWVANHHADPAGRRDQTGSVVRIDPHTNRVVAKIPLGAREQLGGPDNMTATAGDVWLGIPNQAVVARIDARRNRVRARIPVEVGCGHIAGGARAVWVAEGCSNSIVRIDPASNRIVRRIVTTANTYPLVFAHGSVWATTNDLRLIRIDPSSNSIVDSFDIGPTARPTGGPWFTVAAGSVWLIDSNSDRVLRLDLPR